MESYNRPRLPKTLLILLCTVLSHLWNPGILHPDLVVKLPLFVYSAWLLVWQWMMKRVAGLRFLDVAKDILPFMLCAAATMVVTYFMTRSLQNIYLLLLVRLLVSATIYFCIMKLQKVQILEECIAFCKRGR